MPDIFLSYSRDDQRKSGNWGEFCKPVGADDFEVVDPGRRGDLIAPDLRLVLRAFITLQALRA